MKYSNSNRSLFAEKRASAVITSVFLAAVLLVLGLGISNLIAREMRLKFDIIRSAKAYFAAEAASERALLEVKTHLPGFSTKQEVAVRTDDLNFNYEIFAQGDAVPCDDRNLKQVHFEGVDGKRWRILKRNESVVLPLFKMDQQIEKNESFLVRFVVNRGVVDGGLQAGVPASLQETDVLRWKLLAVDNGDGLTVALSDYLPVKGMDGVIHNTLNDPMIFGTGSGDAQYYTVAKFYHKSMSSDEFIFDARYSIQEFLRDPNHLKPYLVLTNVVPERTDEEDFLHGSDEIYFQLVRESGDSSTKFVCEFVKIASDGFYNDYRQSLDTEIKLDSFLPVFDFALYRTEE